jgi:hypothetical protein
VGGGHKKRALAHGYSMDTPSGLRTSSDLAPRVQHKMWDMLAPLGARAEVFTPGSRVQNLAELAQNVETPRIGSADQERGGHETRPYVARVCQSN